MSDSPYISDDRLSCLLALAGFRRGTRWYGSYAWTRWNATLGVSEWLLVGLSGRNNENVVAQCGVGITRTITFGIIHKVLMEAANVKDIADEHGFWVPGRGRAGIKSQEEAKSWEQRFADIAPSVAEAWAKEHGDDLLKQTCNARHKSSEALHLLDRHKSLIDSIHAFRAHFGSDVMKEAERLADWPGVMQVFSAGNVYLLACCAVLKTDERKTCNRQDPLKNDDLMWQIQLVADEIFSWPEELYMH